MRIASLVDIVLLYFKEVIFYMFWYVDILFMYFGQIKICKKN